MSGDISFTHLHVHTQYSLLDGAASIERLLHKAIDNKMNALAITDHGNMFGVVHFVEAAQKIGIKPIIGCEFYVADDRFDRNNRTRYHQILLAKNEIGYKNLSMLSSLSFIDGYYYKPRIDMELLKQYHEGIIATSTCMASRINQTFLSGDEQKAEQHFFDMYKLFKDDYYLELQRFNNLDQERCNQFLLKLALKHNVKVVATNDVHYVNQSEAVAHDILLCIQTGSDYNDPNRMRFCSDTFYLKSTEEMLDAFVDVPEAVYNTQEIVDKCWEPKISHEIRLPRYEVPNNFSSQTEYLRYLTEEGLHKRFNDNITPEIRERIEYELNMIERMGFEGYFLIVQDYINAAKRLDVAVGPGRGSVAGSLVAYCIGITEINSIQYGLFFERFLNPERISMPDIDVDFEDNGREKIINYVADKYGSDHVAHLITFGTLAPKVAIKDVARVLGMSFEQSNKLTKLIPFKPFDSLVETIQQVPELKVYDKKDSLEHKILEIASVLEGCKRQTGIHACGMIIAPDKLTNCIPVKIDKGTDLLVTQYEGSLIEHVGMLKMDFLGLKTLTIIKNTIKMIKQHRGINIDIDNIPLDDPNTLKLFCKGDTVAVFQFESEGMRQWLKKLQPDNIEDLIAMNALFRPGPMQFIEDFINRKHGKEKIYYPDPLLESILKNTYGIIVYQEQVMQVVQVMAGYSLGQADILRKAMGKKNPEEMAKQKTVFIKGCADTHGTSEADAISVFDMMEKFAQYGFNKAHATAYSVIAFQTAYLKTHYPTEFMAASLINAQDNTEALTPIIQDCQRMNIKIHGPNVNKSNYDFDINDDGEICYGLAGIKGVGSTAANTIIDCRKKHGPFTNIYDFIENVNLRTVNKKTLEALALSGALDCLNSATRRQYMHIDSDGHSFIEKLISYINKYNEERASIVGSLFENLPDYQTTLNHKPPLPQCGEYSPTELLSFEKDFIGFYVSGHPLTRYKYCIDYLCNTNSSNVNKNTGIKNEVIKIAGVITKCIPRISKNNKQYAIFTIEDFYGEFSFMIFGEIYNKNANWLFTIGECVIATGQIEPNYNDHNKSSFKCTAISKIKTVLNNIKSVTIRVIKKNLTKDLIMNIKSCFMANDGETKIYVEVVDDDKTTQYESAYRVNICEEFVKTLTTIDNVTIIF